MQSAEIAAFVGCYCPARQTVGEAASDAQVSDLLPGVPAHIDLPDVLVSQQVAEQLDCLLVVLEYSLEHMRVEMEDLLPTGQRCLPRRLIQVCAPTVCHLPSCCCDSRMHAQAVLAEELGANVTLETLRDLVLAVDQRLYQRLDGDPCRPPTLLSRVRPQHRAQDASRLQQAQSQSLQSATHSSWHRARLAVLQLLPSSAAEGGDLLSGKAAEGRVRLRAEALELGCWLSRVVKAGCDLPSQAQVGAALARPAVQQALQHWASDYSSWLRRPEARRRVTLCGIAEALVRLAAVQRVSEQTAERS